MNQEVASPSSNNEKILFGNKPIEEQSKSKQILNDYLSSQYKTVLINFNKLD